MAWGFAQLEGCILIYSNWNGKTKVIRTFFLGYFQAAREQTQPCPRSSLLMPSQVPKGRGEREKEARFRGKFGWFLSYFHPPALILHSSRREIKEHL